MEHVSTLCASSTLGIAASGFALGLPDPAPKHSKFRRKTLSLNLRDHPALTAVPADLSPGIPPPTPNPPRTSHPALSSAANAPPDINPPNDLPPAVRRRPRCQTYSNLPLHSSEDQQRDFHPRRPSSSWLRRLSGISFQTESRFSTPSPISPSFNGSGLASPSCSRPGSQRRPPNKLVKRPSSQQSSTHPSLASGPIPRPSISRRPATSYQRSGPLGHRATHSLTFEPSLATYATSNVPQTQDPGSNRSWRHLFGSKPDGLPGRLVRRFSAATRQRDQGIRRILPNTDALPTLLLGTSITNQRSTAHELDRPHSSIQFRDPFNSVDAVPSSSFDGADPGSPAPSTDTTNVDRLGRCLTPVEGSPSSNRISNHSKSEGALMGSPRKPQKRSAVDPDVFRPSEAAQAAFPTTFLSDGNGPRRRIISFPLSRDAKVDMGPREAVKRPSTSDGVTPSSSQHLFDHQPDIGSFRSRHRAKRHSVAASDPASTVIGSDDTRIFTSGDEDESDFVTDTAFDSIRTHITTNSSSGPQRTRIETLFDRNLSVGLMSEGSSKLDRFIPRGTLAPTQFHDPLPPGIQASPVLTSANALQREANHDSERFSLTDWPDEDAHDLKSPLPGEAAGKLFQPAHKRGSQSPDPFSAVEFPDVDASDISSSQDDPQRTSMDTLGTCSKMNIFDWSEQPRNDSEHPGADVRPRTVHGKDPIGARGSRASGRKVQSTLHLRSQSVPTPREPAFGNESRQTSGKFGTWGLGSKGVSEDWDDDFDFDDADESAVGEEDIKPDEDKCRGGMIVPQAIMERQDSLHGQFGLVQELTLLVEELKRLRQQATVLDIIHGPSDGLWKEAEGIINLATIDEEDNGSLPRSPSSLTFSFDDSEEECHSANSPSKRASGQSWQRSILERADSNPRNSRHARDSSPKAKSALDIVCKRISQDSSIDDGNIPRPRKLPFDTQSLQELVVRAGVVTRALKDVIRNAEGVTTTPGGDSPPPDPPFSRIFDRPSHATLRELETPCVG